MANQAEYPQAPLENGATPKLVQEAMARWKISQEAEQEIRTKALEADRFRVGDQWPTNVKQTREIQSRPCLTINRLPQFIRQVTNDMRMNRPSVKISPVEDNDIETAKVLEGLVRHIQVASNADVAYDTAGDSAVAKGFGYFRVITEYCDDNTFDQDIKIKRIKNAFSVYFDPACVEPDYSDARYCFVVEDIPMDEYRIRYKGTYFADSAFTSTGDAVPDWATDNMVRVAEYWRVEEKDNTLWLLSNGQTLIGNKEEANKAALAAGLTIKNQRPTKVREVRWNLINSNEILEGGNEGQLWPGKWIPIIPVLGEDLDVDGKRHLTGMVYGAMDSQRQYNYMRTAATEAIALAPKAPWVAAAGQIEGYEEIWKLANIQTYSVLPYNPIDVNGLSVPPPFRNHVEPAIQAMVVAIQEAAEDMKATTGIYDAALGARSNETSGKAIIARQKEGDVANFHYIDNLSRAIRHLGVILVDLIPKIYDAPRVVRILGEDMTSKTVHINQPLGKDEKPLGPDTPQDAIDRIYDLTTGKYDVTVEVGPSFSTKRQESADAMIQLAQADNTLMQKAGDIIVKDLDFPQAQALAERLKKFLPPNVTENDASEEIPEQAKMQLEQMGQMIEAMTQQLNQLQDEKEIKAQDIASRERIAAQNNETKMTIEAMKQENNANMELMKAMFTRIQTQLNHSQNMESAEHQNSLTPPLTGEGL